ncbi:DUF1758 domain-containing protein [Nephila pilipes]|uniref:DUF1758 domain-containing protein n=1 Tax=Nephila pilipes TaxID=299642 RepID=A0A8X6KES4_NEPPI|nr:DUF1758 domain-containing protein [Nephila pilipes]
MKFLAEEVEGAVAANNVKVLLVSEYSTKSSFENFNVSSKADTEDKKNPPFCTYCETAKHWPQHYNSVTDIDARLQKLSAINRYFLYFTTRPLELQAFESSSSFSQTRRQIQLQLSSIWDKSKVSINAFESLNKYASHPPPPTDVSRFEKNKRLNLANPDDLLLNLPIEILIGADFFWNAVNSEPPVNLSDSLNLVLSIFGCILSGPRSHSTVSFILTVHNINMYTSTQALDDLVREFWSLKSIGMQPIHEGKKHLETNVHSYTVILWSDSWIFSSKLDKGRSQPLENIRSQQNNGNSSMHYSSTMVPLPSTDKPADHPTHGVRIDLSELRFTFWILPFGSKRIDFTGPLIIRCLKSRDTVYIALFTCVTTRVLYIELESVLTSDKFLLALQRFVGCRELQHTLYTDNATTFHAWSATKKELVLIWQALSLVKIQQYYAQN